MGSALLTGILREGLFAPEQVMINDLDGNRLAQVAEKSSPGGSFEHRCGESADGFCLP